METKYMEINARRTGITVNIYTPEQYAEEMARRQEADKRAHRLNQIQESIGTAVAGIGFLVLLVSGGCSDAGQLIVVGVLGLALFTVGAWLSHAFYGQEDKAEWARR